MPTLAFPKPENRGILSIRDGAIRGRAVFFRIKTVKGRRYLQIVENRHYGGRRRQKVRAALGAVEEPVSEAPVLVGLFTSARRLMGRDEAPPTGRGGGRADSVEGFDLGAYLPYRIERLSQAIGRGSRRFYRMNRLATRDWRVLVLIHSFGSMTAAELVARGTLAKSGVSRSVASLTRRGLIEGARDDADGRRTNLRLTAAGRELVSRLLPYNIARQHRLLDTLTEEERVSLERILEKLESSAERMAKAPDGLG